MDIQFLCRGPVVGQYTDDDVASGLVSAGALGHTKRGVVKRSTAEKGSVAIDEDGQPVISEPKAKESLAACGYDLSAMIHSLPMDGLEYDVVCPSCGNVVNVRRGVAVAEDSDD